MKRIILNITDDNSTLLGQVTLTAPELRAARDSSAGAQALVSDICVEAGIR